MTEHEKILITRVMKRLYSEKRMTADDMRDNAQILNAALDGMFDLDGNETKTLASKQSMSKEEQR